MQKNYQSYKFSFHFTSNLDKQLWKLEDGTLINKAGVWKSNSNWKKRTEEDNENIFILENVSKAKFMTASGKLTSDVNKAQLWKEVQYENDSQYFYFEIYTPTAARRRQAIQSQVLTADPNQLVLEG